MSKFDLQKYLAELEAIVNVDSGTSDVDGVTKVGEYFTNMFKSLGGFTIRKANAKTVAPSWEIFNKGDDKFDILILCHIDTVFPRGTVTTRPYSVDGNKALGPGVNDMKSCILSAFYAIKQLKEENILDKLSICIAFNAEEEIGSKNAREWIESVAKKSAYVIVAEAARSNGDLVIFRKGLGRLTVEITGKAAHAGVNPQDGLSAILLMADWIKEIHALTDFTKGTTLNVGLIAGGTGVNVVADKCKIDIDIRLEDQNEYPKILAKIDELKAQTEKRGGSVEITGGLTRPVMTAGENTLEFAKMVEGVGKTLGLTFGWQRSGGGSDGNFCGALGIPTLDGFGPIGAGSHGVTEYILIDSIEPRIKLLAATMEKIASNK